ncbi:protein kinase family protein [Streptomyces sp. NPDC052077]|uniref:protein kinase family protein n=1 Tax=Streptomyces sp. NPDC052077 TaxID=3154757 RepID=UPI00341735B8
MDAARKPRTAGRGPRYAGRRSAYATAAARLARFGDRALGAAVAAAGEAGSGIGGRRAELEIEGIPVFVKRVPLTEIETRPEHLCSTANLFGLPLFYQYGVGSAGFGAWRELAAHLLTTSWVLGDEYGAFPLLYHWRVLPDRPPPDVADEFGGVDGAVAYWEGSPAVRARLEAIGRSSLSLVLFLEHLPQTLGAWLAGAGDGARPGAEDDGPHLWAWRELLRGAEFLASRGLVHFDAHLANVLTDGEQVYFSDFGLALGRSFDLTPEESAFLDDHLVYDRCYVPWHLLRHHLPGAWRGGAEPGAFLRDWAAGRRPGGVPAGIAAAVDRHAPAALVMDEFARRLVTETKHTPFPAAEIRRALGGPADTG